MLLFVLLFFFQTERPSWFYNPPEGSVAVVARDSYTEDSRLISLYLEANRILKLQHETINTYGYEAIRYSDYKENRYDKHRLLYEFTTEEEHDYVDRGAYSLVAVYRVKNERVYGLFSKDESVKLTENEPVKPEWLNKGSSTTFAVGFSNGNYSEITSWDDAFKHALFQLTMNNNLFIYGDTDQRQYVDDKRKIERRLFEQFNAVMYRFHGIKITGRYFDPEEKTYYLKIETN